MNEIMDKSAEYKKLKKETEELKAQFDNKIVELLQLKRYEGSDKYMYSYQDIADMADISTSYIHRTARDNNLLRK